MKKILLSLTLLSSIVLTSVVQAQQSSNSNQTGRLSQSSRFQEISRRIIDKAVNRFNRYQLFIGKIENRRAKLAQENKDVVQLDNLIRLAKAEIGNVRGAINTAESSLTNLDLSQDVKTNRQTVVNEVRNIREAFRKLHEAVAKAVREAARLNNSN